MTDPRERAARARAHRFLLIVPCVLVCLALLVGGARAAVTTIGLYRDETGSSCSFSNAPGLITAYVVVTPGTGGTRGIRFSAPIPSCFDATFMYETTPPLVTAIGTSEIGISLSPRDCQTEPFSALAITYMDNGGTTPCCEFPILPDGGFAAIEAVDCVFATQSAVANVAHFNADASCPCGLAPPPIPANPVPADFATGRPLSQTLAWDVPDNQGVTYDVYFGTTVPPPLVASNQATQTYNPGGLSSLTTYRWQIVAKRSGTQFPGPIWSFTTAGSGYSPSSPSPADHAVNVAINAVLSWAVSPPQGQTLTFDVYFGTANPPPVVATSQPFQYFNPGPLQSGTTYFWRVVAHDLGGGSSSGPLWTFATSGGGLFAPSTPSPSDHATEVSLSALLSWAVSPPQGQPLTFDVYFGTANPPPLVTSGGASQNFNPGLLLPLANYFWRIVARDLNGTVSSGPVWTFMTGISSNIPLMPSNPNPPDNGFSSSFVHLSWTSSGTSFTTFVSTSPLIFPGLIAIGSTTTPEYSPGLLGAGRFYWQVYADGTAGPVWSFITSGGSLPVAFTHFDATSSGNAVDIRWELASDEAMSGFTLYRQDGASLEAHVVAGGAVVGATGSYLDATVDAGKTYRYELLVRTADGDEFRSQQATVTVPARALTLYQNTPNPFNPQTTIRYDLPTGSTRVQLSIFDAMGRNVRTLVDEVQSGGSRSAIWNGRDDAGNAVSSGVYFYVLDAGKERLTRKLVLLK